jgi:hypothetical protein
MNIKRLKSGDLKPQKTGRYRKAKRVGINLNTLKMKKILLLTTTLISVLSTNAQTWSKLSTNFDSLWKSSVKYFNKGDTLIYYGSTTGTGSFNAKRFYVSTNGGQTFTRDFTALDAIGYSPIFGLPINNMIIGFQNIPNDGSYSFQGLNNWTSLLPQGVGIYGEVNSGTLLWNAGSGNTTLRTMTTSGGNLTIVASGSGGIDLVCSYNKGNRLFLGGGSNNVIKYVDNGNFANIQTSTIASQGSGSDVVRFFEAGANLFAVVDAGTNKLFKSTDNGVTWTIVNTTYNSSPLTSSFIIGTPNGNIFFLESSSGTSDNVFLSTDDGATAVKISNGLPTNGLLHSPTIGKILTNGNKVWYQVCAANTVDFVRTDTTIAGLYVFNSGSTGVNESLINSNEISIYPNPTSYVLTIDTRIQFDKIEIYNSIGRLVKVSKENNIDISNLDRGVYLINLRTKDNKTASKKVIIQ